MNSLAVHAANSWSNNFISCPSARLQWPRGKALSLKDKGRGRGEEASKELWPSFLSISVAQLSFMCAVSRDLKKQTEHYVKSKQWEQPSKTEYVVALVLQAWQQIQKSELVIFYSVPLVLMLVCCVIFLKGYRGSSLQMTFSAFSMQHVHAFSMQHRGGRTKQKKKTTKIFAIEYYSITTIDRSNLICL